MKTETEDITFRSVNLYDNHLSNAFVDIALRGRQISVENRQLAQDLSTNGCFPKAWIRTAHGFQLLKDGGQDAVEREILASRICQCFQCKQVIYQEGSFEDEVVSVSEIMTTKQYSIASRESFEIYAANHELDALEYILQLDAYSYYMMNILDYLVGNTDRHWGNWGFLVDNETNQPIGLHPLMDFNRAFYAYDTLEGANCQTRLPRIMTQREAAVEAVGKIGLNRIADIEKAWFKERRKEYEMFRMRLEYLEGLQ